MILRVGLFQFQGGDVMTLVGIEPIPVLRYRNFMSKCDAITDYANQLVVASHFDIKFL